MDSELEIGVDDGASRGHPINRIKSATRGEHLYGLVFITHCMADRNFREQLYFFVPFPTEISQHIQE